MPPRPIWKGHLKLSLVSFGVRLYAATETSSKIHFNMLHRDCGQRLKQQMICPVHGTVERSDIVKGYEYEDGRYVVVDPEELKKLEAATSKTIDIDQFVKESELEPIYYDRPYYLGPDGNVAMEPFLIMHEAMKRSKKIGIGRVVMHGSEQRVALELEGKGFRLVTLRAADEIRNPAEYFEEVHNGKLRPAELKLAEELIEGITEPLDISTLRDRYQEAVQKLIQAKIEGEEPVIVEQEEAPKSFNFLEALRASVGESKGKSRRKKPRAKSVASASSKKKVKRRKSA